MLNFASVVWILSGQGEVELLLRFCNEAENILMAVRFPRNTNAVVESSKTCIMCNG